MAGTLKTSQFNSATVANPTDEVPLLQGGQLKRVQVKVLTGNPDVGWQASGETWSYSSYSSTTRAGVVTVPSDATTKYVRGMRVRFSQATGGTKYGIIISLTTTTLTIFFPNGTALTNETLTSPVYSPLFAPVGFPTASDTDPYLWSLQAYSSVAQTINNPTLSQWYQAGASLTLPAGLWRVKYQRHLTVTSASIGVGGQTSIGTSTTGGRILDLHAQIFDVSSLNSQSGFEHIAKVAFASATTLYPQLMRDGGTGTLISHEAKVYATNVIAECPFV